MTSPLYASRRAMRIAIDIDSTLHHYWDLFALLARRRFGVDAGLRGAGHVGHRAAAPRAGRSARRRDATGPSTCSAAEPYAGAVETVARLARGRPLHPHHEPPLDRRARGDRRVARADRPAVRRPALLVGQDHPLRRDRHRRADRRQPAEHPARAGGRASSRRRSRTRGTASCAPRRAIVCAADWHELAEQLAPLLDGAGTPTPVQRG